MYMMEQPWPRPQWREEGLLSTLSREALQTAQNREN